MFVEGFGQRTAFLQCLNYVLELLSRCQYVVTWMLHKRLTSRTAESSSILV